jgi:hypothetical protein
MAASDYCVWRTLIARQSSAISKGLQSESGLRSEAYGDDYDRDGKHDEHPHKSLRLQWPRFLGGAGPAVSHDHPAGALAGLSYRSPPNWKSGWRFLFVFPGGA